MPEADASNVLPKPAPFGLPEADDAAISRASLNDVLCEQTPALATLLSAAVVFVLARLVADPWFHLSLDLMAGILFAVAMFLAVTALLRRAGSTAPAPLRFP